MYISASAEHWEYLNTVNINLGILIQKIRTLYLQILKLSSSVNSVLDSNTDPRFKQFVFPSSLPLVPTPSPFLWIAYVLAHLQSVL